MSNKTNIEEDIKILKNITKQDFNNPMGWTGYYDSELKELQQAIENILTDRERLKAKANKYDSLIERIKQTDKDIAKMKVEGEVFKTAVNFARKELQELLREEN